QVTYVPNSAKINGTDAGSAATFAANKLTVNLGAMAVGNVAEEKTISFRVTINSNAPIGSFTNKATVTTGGSNPHDCSSTLNVPPRGTAWCEKYAFASATASVPMTYESGVVPGQKFYYKAKIESDGLTRGKVTFTDKLPDEVTYIGGANKTPEGLSYD